MKLVYLAISMVVLQLLVSSVLAQSDAADDAAEAPAYDDYDDDSYSYTAASAEETSIGWEIARDFGSKSPLIIAWMIVIIVGLSHLLAGRTLLGGFLAIAGITHLVLLPVEIVFENFVYYGTVDTDISENGELYVSVLDMFLSIFRGAAWFMLMIALGVAVRTPPPEK